MSRAGAPMLCERLARYARGLTYERLPAEAVARLKGVMLHDLVVAVAGSGTDEVARAMALVDSDFGATGRCTIIRHGRRVSPSDAAFANAVMMRTLRQEDTLIPAGIHAGVLTIPVALALAEHLGRSGREVIAAVMAGYDVAAALEESSPQTRANRTASHVYGAFAAATTAAKLLGLDEEQFAGAIAHAGNLGAMINSGFEDHMYGILVRNGMLAAHLGRSRAPWPRNAIEGIPGFFAVQVGRVPKDFAPVDDLGARHAVLASALKPYPGAHANSVAITLVKDLVAKHRLQADDVARVVVHRPAESNDASKLSKGPFATRLNATSSVPFAVAATLMDGDYTLGRLDRYDDPAILRVTERVDVDTNVHVNSYYNRVDIHMRDGTLYSVEGDQQLIASTDPMAIVNFHRSVPIDEAGVLQLAATIERLETLGSVAELVAQL
jgi:2-methylcitrate dehydratase PrpD